MVTAFAQEINVISTSSSCPLTADAVINLDHGDLTMYEPFWQQIGDRAIIVIPGSQIMSYFSDDANVAKKMTKFIEMNTIGVFKDSQLRAAKIMKVVSDGYELPDSKTNDRLFDNGRKVLASRCEILKEVVKIKGMFSLPEYPLEACIFYREKTMNFLLLHG